MGNPCIFSNQFISSYICRLSHKNDTCPGTGADTRSGNTTPTGNNPDPLGSGNNTSNTSSNPGNTASGKERSTEDQQKEDQRRLRHKSLIQETERFNIAHRE